MQSGCEGREAGERRNRGTVGIQSSNKDLVKIRQRLKKVSSEFQRDEPVTGTKLADVSFLPWILKQEAKRCMSGCGGQCKRWRLNGEGN